MALQARLLEDTIERPHWHVGREISSDRNRTGFNEMLELSVASASANVTPTIFLD